MVEMKSSYLARYSLLPRFAFWGLSDTWFLVEIDIVFLQNPVKGGSDFFLTNSDHFWSKENPSFK